MPIIERSTNTHNEVSTRFEGRVVEIRTYTATRNHSDTLDYSDYQETQVTEALIYLGRHGNPLDGIIVGARERDLAVHERFFWLDCTNLFTWRGAPRLEAIVDAFPLGVGLDPNFIEDYTAFKTYEATQIRFKEESKKRHEKEQRVQQEERERNFPVKGKQMVVFKGRKVPVGTKGTVAWTDGNRVLLKDDNAWTDRNTPGTWVSAQHLKART